MQRISHCDQITKKRGEKVFLQKQNGSKKNLCRDFRQLNVLHILKVWISLTLDNTDENKSPKGQISSHFDYFSLNTFWKK